VYALGAAVPVGDVSPGTTLLCVGPSMIGKSTVLYRALAAAALDGAGSIVVSTDDGADTVIERFDAAVDAVGGGDADGGDLGIVDCTDPDAGRDGGSGRTGGQSRDQGRDRVRVRGISSPADLTGLWMATTDLLETLGDAHGRVVIVIDSLTTLSVYADADRLAAFANAFAHGIARAGAVALVSVDDDAVPESSVRRIESFVDGRIEVRAGDDAAIEARATGVEGPSAWTTVASIERGRPGGSGGDPLRPPDEIDPSLAAIVDAVADTSTLAIRGYDGPGDVLDRLRSYFDRQSVDVRNVGADLEEPSGYALLHRGDELLAGVDVDALYAAIEVDADGGQHRRPDAATALLSAASGAVYGGHAAGTALLVSASRTIESLAWRRGTGNVHAGFQRLSRLVGDPKTRRVYRRLAERGVSLHLYGAPDASVPDWPGTRIYTEDGELRSLWFVVYDGGATVADAAALVAYRTGDRALAVDEHPLDATYRAFWTHRPGPVARTLAYLEATYVDGRPPVGDGPGPRVADIDVDVGADPGSGADRGVDPD